MNFAVLSLSTHYAIHTAALSLLHTLRNELGASWDAIMTIGQDFAVVLDVMEERKAKITTIVDEMKKPSHMRKGILTLALIVGDTLNWGRKKIRRQKSALCFGVKSEKTSCCIYSELGLR